MIHFPKRLLAIAALTVVGFVGLGTPQASAGFTSDLLSVTGSSGHYVWDYDINIGSNTTIAKGDFFTIYDFAGFVPGSNSQPAGWSFSSSNLGVTAPGLNPKDNSAIPNLTWTYNGTNDLVGPQTLVKDFTAMSAISAQVGSAFGSQTHRTDNGLEISNVSALSVPVPADRTPSAPEPCTLVLFGLALPVLGAANLLRHRKTAVV